MYVYKVPETVIGYEITNQMGTLLKERGKSRALILCDGFLAGNGLIESALSSLETKGLRYELFTEIEPELPVETIERAFEVAEQLEFDAIVAIGGGSCIDCAKILSAMVANGQSVNEMIGTGKVKGPGIFTAAVPTTSGTGAEVTPNAIVKWSSQNRKDSIVSSFIVPDLVILDASLTITLPAHLTAWTGLDALTHAIEAFTSKRSNAYSDMYAREVIRLIAGSLRTAVYSPHNRVAREEMLFGSFLAGFCITHAGTGAVHALAYPLGGTYDVQHGLSNAVFLAEVMKANLPACIGKYAEVAGLFGCDEPRWLREKAEKSIALINELCTDLGIDEWRKTIPLKDGDINAFAEEAHSIRRLMDNNPRELSLTQVRDIYESVFFDVGS